MGLVSTPNLGASLDGAPMALETPQNTAKMSLKDIKLACARASAPFHSSPIAKGGVHL